MGARVSIPQKIRFRRGEIVGLHTLPSAGGAGHVFSLARMARVAALASGGLVVVLVSLVAALLAVGSISISSERLTQAAERAVAQMVGEEVRLVTGEARLAFGLTRPFGLELRDVSVTTAETGEARLSAGLLQFSVRLLPLLAGEVRLAGATVSDVDLRLAELPAAPGGGLLAQLAGADGLVGADDLVAFAFNGLAGAMDALDGSGTGLFVVENLSLDLGARKLLIARAGIAETAEGAAIDVAARLGERDLAVSGRVGRGPAGAMRLDLGIDVPAPAAGADPEQPGMLQLGALRIELTGDKADAASAGALRARIETTGTRIRVGHSVPHTGRIALDLRLDGTGSRYDIARLEAGDGRTDITLSGSVDLVGQGAAPHYGFRLASGGSLLAPADSLEPALAAAIFSTGRVDARFRSIVADRLVVATGQSEVLATLAIDLPETGGSGLRLAVNVADLPTAHAKNLWPWFGAGSARGWTLRNVFGGVVKEGRLELNLPAGRLASGIPLTPDDLSGHFVVHGARFDMAGSIPPMRDAVGIVDIAGKDVTISLESGTVYTEAGRTLSARKGSFRIPDTHIPPLRGLLSLDVEGSADAVAEIANYEPISLSRYMKLDPEGMAGTVSGHVDATIPLVAASRDTIDWSVDLAFSGLNVPQAFQGQKLSEADGRLRADPTRAVIEAKGRLNGVPADFSLEEPLGADKSGRRMIAELQVNDSSREALMPGLGAIVSGPFALTLLSREDGASDITADLTSATLQVPWIGWEKKPGVAANASFVMRRAGGVTRIEEFSAGGRGFSAAGIIEVDAKGFARAEFSRLSLHEGDDLATTVARRNGGGYAVTVRGRKGDVRSVVGEFNLDTRDGDGGWTATDKFSLDLELDAATGFHGETLRDLKLVFSGPGTTVGGMRASARTASGAPVSIVDATIGNERRLELAAGNAGEVLRFLNLYQNVRGGVAELRLSGAVGKALSGPLIARGFDLIEEQRLETMVNRAAPGSDRSLNQTVNSAVDTARAQFDVAYAVIEKGEGYLKVADGVVRGGSIGATFQGTVFDRSGNMLVTGTFMPAYGINRLFGEIPLLGVILGNGRDRGLIGITFRLHGKTANPQVSVNPLSVIAPGIFRKIFEFQPKQMDTGETE